jgi:ribonuclease P protein component
MLPKRRRLSAREVKEVMTAGRSRRASLLSAKYSPNNGVLRASAVVSKKVAKKAVERNRLRRALYRALAAYEGTGTAVIFIQKVPPDPLTPAFARDLVVLLKN